MNFNAMIHSYFGSKNWMNPDSIVFLFAALKKKIHCWDHHANSINHLWVLNAISIRIIILIFSYIFIFFFIFTSLAIILTIVFHKQIGLFFLSFKTISNEFKSNRISFKGSFFISWSSHGTIFILKMSIVSKKNSGAFKMTSLSFYTMFRSILIGAISWIRLWIRVVYLQIFFVAEI